METTDNVHSTSTPPKPGGILYSMMLIAAIAIIIFSVVGIATMTGYMPKALSKDERAATDGAPGSSQGAPGTAGAPRSAAPKRSAPAEDRAPEPRSDAAAPTVAEACSTCGVVESVRAVESRGQGSGLGVIGGAVVGGILGNQIGRGGGRTAATVVGAGAGAYAGNELERNTGRRVSYQVRIRMDDGTLRTFYEAVHPAYAIGQKVRVTSDAIAAAG